MTAHLSLRPLQASTAFENGLSQAAELFQDAGLDGLAHDLGLPLTQPDTPLGSGLLDDPSDLIVWEPPPFDPANLDPRNCPPLDPQEWPTLQPPLSSSCWTTHPISLSGNAAQAASVKSNCMGHEHQMSSPALQISIVQQPVTNDTGNNNALAAASKQLSQHGNGVIPSSQLQQQAQSFDEDGSEQLRNLGTSNVPRQLQQKLSAACDAHAQPIQQAHAPDDQERRHSSTPPMWAPDSKDAHVEHCQQARRSTDMQQKCRPAGGKPSSQLLDRSIPVALIAEVEHPHGLSASISEPLCQPSDADDSCALSNPEMQPTDGMTPGQPDGGHSDEGRLRKQHGSHPCNSRPSHLSGCGELTEIHAPPTESSAPPSLGRGTSVHATLSSTSCMAAEPLTPNEDASDMAGPTAVHLQASHFDKATCVDLRLMQFTTLPSLMSLKSMPGTVDTISPVVKTLPSPYHDRSTDSDLESEAGQPQGNVHHLDGSQDGVSFGAYRYQGANADAKNDVSKCMEQNSQGLLHNDTDEPQKAHGQATLSKEMQKKRKKKKDKKRVKRQMRDKQVGAFVLQAYLCALVHF